jgi:hypothetical protein
MRDAGFEPVFYPGPYDVNSEQLSPDAMLFLSIGGGPGLHGEAKLDRSLITVRSIGPQSDYDGAEAQAFGLDAIFLAVERNTVIGTATVLYINRAGGRPELLLHDASGRYHFTCSYVTEATSGL